MKVSVIWHKRKIDMPKAMSVPEGEIHLWYCKKNVRGKDKSYVEVRGIPLTYDVVFRADYADGARLNLINGSTDFPEEDISNFFHYMRIAKKEAAQKLKAEDSLKEAIEEARGSALKQLEKSGRGEIAEKFR